MQLQRDVGIEGESSTTHLRKFIEVQKKISQMEGSELPSNPSFSQMKQSILNVEVTNGKTADDMLLFDLAEDHLDSNRALSLAYLSQLSSRLKADAFFNQHIVASNDSLDTAQLVTELACIFFSLIYLLPHIVDLKEAQSLLHAPLENIYVRVKQFWEINGEQVKNETKEEQSELIGLLKKYVSKEVELREQKSKQIMEEKLKKKKLHKLAPVFHPEQMTEEVADELVKGSDTHQPDKRELQLILANGYIVRFAHTPYFSLLAGVISEHSQTTETHPALSLAFSVGLLCKSHLHLHASSLVMACLVDTGLPINNISTSLCMLKTFLQEQSGKATPGEVPDHSQQGEAITWSKCSDLCSAALITYQEDCE